MENLTISELQELQNSGKKLLVDYWAPWCGPCKMLIPRLERLESQYPDVTFVKINVDENRDHSMDVGVRSVPTVMFYDGTNKVSQMVGALADDRYTEVLKSL